MRTKLKDKSKFLKSLSHCIDGLFYTFTNERNFRIETTIGIIVLICSFIFKVSIWEYIVVLLLVCFVLILELLNTALERVVDLYTLEKHPLAKAVKDIASASVLVMAFFSAIIGGLIFIPKIIELISKWGD